MNGFSNKQPKIIAGCVNTICAALRYQMFALLKYSELDYTFFYLKKKLPGCKPVEIKENFVFFLF